MYHNATTHKTSKHTTPLPPWKGVGCDTSWELGVTHCGKV